MAGEPYITLHSGNRFYLASPELSVVRIDDVSHGLSLICRYTGQCREMFSVAQHSLLVSEMVSEKNALWGLLHDASEAYLTDVSGPLKKMPELEGYRRIEERVMRRIASEFGLSWPMPKEVHDADAELLMREMECLGMVEPNGHSLPVIVPMSSLEAEREFLRRYRMLTRW